MTKVASYHEKALERNKDDPRGDLPGRWRDHAELCTDENIKPFSEVAGEFGILKFTSQLTRWLFEKANDDDDWETDGVVESSFGGSPYFAIRYVCKSGVEHAAQMGRDVDLFHGTWFFAARNLVHERRLRESHDGALGHDYNTHHQGVYTSPKVETAKEYARPSPLPFSPGFLHRSVFMLKGNLNERASRKKDGGDQWICSEGSVTVAGLLVFPNSAPRKGEEFFRLGTLIWRLCRNSWS